MQVLLVAAGSFTKTIEVNAALIQHKIVNQQNSYLRFR